MDEAFANEATDYTAARSRPPSTAAVFGLAELSSHSAHGGVSTFRKVRRYSQEAPNQPSRSSPPILATAPKSSQPAGQTFQQAIQVQTLAPCPSQDWPRHRPHKLANIRQDPAFGSSLAHNVAWEALTTVSPFTLRNLCTWRPWRTCSRACARSASECKADIAYSCICTGDECMPLAGSHRAVTKKHERF